MGIPVLRGRGVTEQDTESDAWVVVINEAMARRVWPNEDPIVKTIRFDDSPQEKLRLIVGVVGDVKQFVLTRPSEPEAYIAYQTVVTRAITPTTDQISIVGEIAIFRHFEEIACRAQLPASPRFGLDSCVGQNKK